MARQAGKRTNEALKNLFPGRSKRSRPCFRDSGFQVTRDPRLKTHSWVFFNGLLVDRDDFLSKAEEFLFGKGGGEDTEEVLLLPGD